MNIKKALEVIKIKREGIAAPWIRFEEIIEVLEAVDEPTEHHDISKCECTACHNSRVGFYNENCKLKADLAFANKSSELFREENTQLRKQLFEAVAPLNGFVPREEYQIAINTIKQLESKLRVEGYRIEVKDAKINHLKTVLKVNGIKTEEN